MIPKLTLVFLVSLATVTAAVKQGDVFPSPAAHGVSGKLPATKGKVVLYDFWASWCAPCRAALPGYEKIYQKYRSMGFEVIAVGTDDNAEAAKKFTNGLKLSFPVVADTGQKFVALVSPSSMPTAYLVGKDDKVISVHKGFHGEKSINELSAAIEAALK